MAMQFSPKIMGLNAEIFWTVLGILGLIFELLLVHVFHLCIIAEMNNMLVVCKLCYYIRI